MLASEKFIEPRGDDSKSLSLFASLTPHMQALDLFLQEEVERFEPEIQEMVRYCLGSGGKRLRPALVFFAGWRDGRTIPAALVKVAAVIELVHLATLVHDDILDSASVRHGRTTASRKFGSETAVLLGDALFAHAVNLSTDFPGSEVCRLVSRATRRVCAGEIAQTARRGAFDITLTEYFRIIELKTAELFRVSCFLGARLGEYSDEFCEAAGRFGVSLGTGYQIYDDLTDFFGKEEQTGKTLGTDLINGKYTLPVILLLQVLGDEEKAEFCRDVCGNREEKVEKWLARMVESGVHSDVAGTVLEKAREAEQAIEPFENLPPVSNLLWLSDFLKSRTTTMEAMSSRG